jgi:iron complex transport system substrate-binding protein
VKRHAIALLLVAVAFVAAGFLVRTRWRGPTRGRGVERIVSLSPAITETLFAVGKGPAVVGVSDYCDRPAEAKRLPRVGTGLTPHYEAITQLEPTLILAERNASTRRESLEALAPTVLLPWLTLDEMTASVRRIGELTASRSVADALADRLHTVLSAPPPPGAPRVLLVLGNEPGRLTEVWYIKRNSLHGNVLHAAGGSNAVARDETGPPRLSLANVIALDPEIVVILAPRVATPDAAWLDPWSALTPLRAVARHRIGVLRSTAAFNDGPSILELVSPLQAEIQRLSAAN